MENEPMLETTAQKILKQNLLGFGVPKELPEPKKANP